MQTHKPTTFPHRFAWVWVIALAAILVASLARLASGQRVAGSGNVTLHNDPARDIAWAEFGSKDDRTVQIRVSSGQVVVTGVEGDSVWASARSLDPDVVKRMRERSAPDPRAEGLRKVTHGETGLEMWTDPNVIEVTTRHFSDVQLDVHVPRDVNVTISSQFADSVLVRFVSGRVKVRGSGSVRLERVSGEIEVQASGGWIYLDRVSGSVVANSSFGGIEGSIVAVGPNTPISLSASGTIDLALPASTPASLHIKSSFGEIFTDFDMHMRPRPKDTDVDAPRVRDLYESQLRVYELERRALRDARRAETNAQRLKEEVERAEEEAARAEAESQAERERAPRDRVAPDGRFHGVPPVPDPPTVYVLPTPVNKAPMIGDINGGGPEVRITTMIGNIYVRKMRERK